MNSFKRLWYFLGTSNAWLIVALSVIVTEVFLGATLLGVAYTFISLIAFFLARIAEAIEALANKDK